MGRRPTAAPVPGRAAVVRGALAALAALTCLALGGGGAAAGESVAVRAWDHGNYARIVFDWKTPVEYSARLEGVRLVVEFARPMSASLDTVLERLSDKYVRRARLEGGGRRAVFTLKRPFEPHTFVNDGAVVVDLLDAPGAAAPDESADIAPAGAADAPAASPSREAADELPVRTGQHTGYSRLVFDWTRRVDYRVERDGATATIVFDRPARIDIASLRAGLPRYVEGAGLADRAGATALEITVAESARLRHFRDNTKVVLDVLRPAAGPEEDKDESAGDGSAAAAAGAGDSPAGGSRKALAAPPVPLVPQAPPSESPSPPADAAASGDGDGDAPVPAPAASAKTAPDETPPSDEAPPDPRPTAAEAAPAPEVEAPPAGSGTAPAAVTAEVPPPAPSGARVPVTAETGGGGVILRFEWGEDVAAAAFRRAGGVWVVFARPADLDFSGFPMAAREIVHDAVQVPSDGATAVRLDTGPEFNPKLARDGTAWVVDLHPRGLAPETGLEVETRPGGEGGARLFVPVTGVAGRLELRDPEVGDTLTVLPVSAPGVGLSGRREYAQLNLLASAQGVVVDPRADGVAVRVQPRGVEITGPGGLYLSGAAPAAETAAAKARSRRLFRFEAWAGDPDLSFRARRERRQNAIAEAPPEGRNRARLDLARFYFAHGFAADALGVMDTIDREAPQMIEDPAYRALRGATRFLRGDLEKAEKDLFHIGLDGKPEAMLWRAALAAKQKRWSEAARNFAEVGDLIQDYPADLRDTFALLAVETALATDEITAANVYLAFIGQSDASPAIKARAAYLEGRVKLAEGDRDAAMALWEEAARGADRLARARAELARTDLLLDEGQMTTAEAVEEMEKLRFAWRGDGFEFDLLHRLGQLYIEMEDYARGLAMLRRAVTNFPDYDDSKVIAQEMGEVFERLFLEGEADRLPPVKALAIYRDFRELTPGGAKGDEMIQKLADRLVAVDLLGQAAELLDQQVRFRLSGADKARVGARLAMIRLLDKKPDLALDALEASAVDNLPDETAEMRRTLEARALAGLGRNREALALLAGRETPAADRLRAAILWRGQDWSGAARVLERLVDAQAPTDGTAAGTAVAATERAATAGEGAADEAAGGTEADVLAEGTGAGAQAPGGPARRQRDILRLAVALFLSGDYPGLDSVRRRYADVMRDSPYRDDFRIVTARPGGDVDNLQEVVARVAAVDEYAAFLAAYRERLERRARKGDEVSGRSRDESRDLAAAN